jgi:hypothetical protein
VLARLTSASCWGEHQRQDERAAATGPDMEHCQFLRYDLDGSHACEIKSRDANVMASWPVRKRDLRDEFTSL